MKVGERSLVELAGVTLPNFYSVGKFVLGRCHLAQIPNHIN